MKRESFEDISLMRSTGQLLFIAGLGVFAWGLNFDATFAASEPSLYGVEPDRIFNIGLVAEKLTFLIGGATLGLFGSGMMLAAGIRRDIRHAATIQPEPSRPDAG